MLTKCDFLFLITLLCTVAMAVVWATSSCLIKTEACNGETEQNKPARKPRKRKVQLDDCHNTAAATTTPEHESSPSQMEQPAVMSQQVKIETLRKLMRDIDTEIRDLKVYSKFAEAKRCSIRESCAKKLEKMEKIQACVVLKDSATV